MASKPVELPISSWAPPASPLRIEYSNEVMEEMRARATEGFYKLIRGGVEIAGLLLGSVQHDSIRVLAQLPFEIEYAYGPVFSLSPRDVANLRKLIEDVASANLPDPIRGKAYRVLGLYVSHSRSGMALSEEESRLIDQLFPHAWQTVLILKPSRSSETAATFFVREQNGEMRANQPYGLFVVTPAMGERRARPAASATADPSLIALAGAASNTASREAPATPVRQPVSPPPIPEPPSPARSLSDEDTLARRALPEKPPPPPVPPQAAEVLPPESRSEPALDTPPNPVTPEAPASAARDLELLSLPRPLAALVVEPDLPAAPPPAAPVPETPHEEAALVPDTPEWHEEEQPAPRLRATPWLRWAIPSVGLVLLLVLGYLVYHTLNSAPPTVMFFTRDAGENPEVIWQLKGLSDARSAVITIETNGEIRRIDLIRAGRLSGTYKDPFLTGASKVVLEIERASGEVIHRVATLVPADSVVDYLSGGLLPDSVPAAAVEVERSAAENGAGANETPAGAPDLSLSVRSPEPILATPVEQEPKPVAPVPSSSAATPALAGSALAQPSAARQEAERRAGLPPAALNRPQTASPIPPPPSPEAPVQTRVTEAPAQARPESPRAAVTAQSNAALRPEPRSNASVTNAAPAQASATTPTSVIRPAQNTPSVQAPPSPVRVPVPNAKPPATATPAPPRVSAGRSIWTGQLGKNESLQINGKQAGKGNLHNPLPGQPVAVNVHPGKLTPEGLVVYTSNPRYRNAQNAIEPPGPTNGWNRTRYVYDPARANSLVVVGVPSQANGWQGISLQNGNKEIDAVVIDWQVQEP